MAIDNFMKGVDRQNNALGPYQSLASNCGSAAEL